MKRQIRHRMRSKLAALPGDAAGARSRSACEALVRLDEFGDARVVMLYLAIQHEIDPGAAALAAWQDDKTVLVPKVVWDRKQMSAVPIRSLDDGVETTPAGLREPASGGAWPVEEIDLIVAPGLAFDRRGNRLGRGGGFYDRFLARAGMRATVCGLAFAEQILDEVPAGARDYPMDLIVTDAEVLRFAARAARRRKPPAAEDNMER